MTEEERDAQTAAMSLIRQYGDDAAVIATLRAAEVAAVGDGAALAHWDAVIAFLENGPSSGQKN